MACQPLPSAGGSTSRDDESLSAELMRLLLTTAGSKPLSAEEVGELLRMADPQGTGFVRFGDFKALACFDVDADVENDDSDATDAADGRTGSLVYATVPAHVSGGDIIAVELPSGDEVRVVVPHGLAEGDTFGLALARQGRWTMMRNARTAPATTATHAVAKVGSAASATVRGGISSIINYRAASSNGDHLGGAVTRTLPQSNLQGSKSSP